MILRFRGRYPVLKIEFDSDRPEFDAADVQSLIFTGQPAGAGSGNTLQDASVNIVTEDLLGTFSDLLLAPFLSDIEVKTRIGRTAVGIDVFARLGKMLRLRTQVTQQGVDTNYDTGFEVKFTDRVFLEGKLKVRQQEQDRTETYEAKIKYRIPLDE